MNRRSLIRNAMTASAGFFLPHFVLQPLWADKKSAEKRVSDDFTIRSDVRLVLLDVSVKDHEGGLVSGLAKENFTVVENGKSQPITIFDHDDLPVTLGILVDESRSMTPKRNDVLRASDALIAESNPNDEIFVVNFNERAMLGLAPGPLFSDDPLKLHDALYRGVPEGRTALYDAVVLGLEQLEMGQRAKKTLIVISDGGDNASHHTRRETMDLVQRSTATIFTIGLFDADDADKDPGILRELAKISGGEAYLPQSTAEMLPLCHRIAKDIRARYTVGYLPQPGISGGLRHIEVRAVSPDRGKLNTRSRSSYVYEEAGNARK
jgi:Ca-activated chloride channel family protein